MEDTFVTYWEPIVVSRTIVRGTVTDVDDHEFTLHTGARALRVDVAPMSYDPLDDKGYQKVNVGDRVSVTDKMESDLSRVVSSRPGRFSYEDS